jgi:hypothetical protein
MGSDPSFLFKSLKYKPTALNRTFHPLQVTWSRRARRLRLEPIRHPQSEPPEMGFDALDSGSGMVDDGFSLFKETEFVIVGALLILSLPNTTLTLLLP